MLPRRRTNSRILNHVSRDAAMEQTLEPNIRSSAVAAQRNPPHHRFAGEASIMHHIMLDQGWGSELQNSIDYMHCTLI